MPFGISSAPEIWQQRMNQIVEGLTGVEDIADDFLVCGLAILMTRLWLTMMSIYTVSLTELVSVV